MLHTGFMEKLKKTLFVLAIQALQFTLIPALAQTRHEIALSIEVYNRSNGETLNIEPQDNYQFEIVSQKGSAYRLKVFDREGKPVDGDFVTHKGNVENNFTEIAVEALANFTSQVESAGNPPHCDCEEDVFSDLLSEAESLVVDPSVRAECQIEGTDAKWRENCSALFDKGFPAGSLEYALKVMKLNATSFRSNKCWDQGKIKYSGHPSMNGLTPSRFENDLMGNGLKNKCQFIINDTDDRSPSSGGDDCRGQMYYVDLCQGDEPVVKKDYFNLGTGTCRGGRNGFMNQSEKRTTLLGAFFTHNDPFDFTDTTKQQSQYRAVRKDVKDMGGPNRASALQLFGLSNTNNLSSHDGKYIHVSPHRSSWGCPSVRPSNYYMIENLAANGPSLVLHWAKKGMEPIETCSE